MRTKMFMMFMMCMAVMVVAVGGFLVGCGGGGPKFSYELVEVVMTVEASQRSEPFTVNDFPELNLAQVRDWSEYFTWIRKGELTLTLAEPSRQNVLQAVYLLNSRDDIYSAALSYFVSIP